MDKRNKMERQAIAALAHLANGVLFLLDPTETCGYPLTDQRRLLEEVRTLFPNVPILVVETKSDLSGVTRSCELQVSAVTGSGVRQALDLLDLRQELEQPFGDCIEVLVGEDDVRLRDASRLAVGTANLLEEDGVAVRKLRGDQVELLLVLGLQPRDRAVHKPHMPDSLDDVPGAGFAFRPDHGGPFPDPPDGLAEVPAPADERDAESPLVHVEERVRGDEDFGLVDHVDTHRLEGPRLRLVPDSAFGHHRHRDGIHDLLNLDRIVHARDAARRPDVRGHALQGHHRHRSRFLGDGGLLRVRDVHDDATLLHLREAALQQFGPESHPRQVEVERDGIPPGRAYGPWVFLICVAGSVNEGLSLSISRDRLTLGAWARQPPGD